MSSASVIAPDFPFLIFPGLLLGYYVLCWAIAGKDPKIRDVAPQYEPPAGISPALARYIITGGSDGTTLAAVLADLALQDVISIQPQGNTYRLELLQEKIALPAEEATLVQALFSQEMQAGVVTAGFQGEAQPTAELRDAVRRISSQQLASRGLAVAAELAREPRRVVVIDPKSSSQIKLAIDAIQKSLRRSVQGLYFHWNFSYVLAGMAATFIFGLTASFFAHSPYAPPTFLTVWLLLFTSIAGVVMALGRSARPAHPTAGQRVTSIVLLLFFFILPGFLIAAFAMPSAKWFVLALLASVALNSAFMVLMRAPTAEGRKALEQLAGFREFLGRVEQDCLERINAPQEKARAMDRFLPYAIALEVKEGWGDTMAAALSNAIVER